MGLHLSGAFTCRVWSISMLAVRWPISTTGPLISSWGLTRIAPLADWISLSSSTIPIWLLMTIWSPSAITTASRIRPIESLTSYPLSLIPVSSISEWLGLEGRLRIATWTWVGRLSWPAVRRCRWVLISMQASYNMSVTVSFKYLHSGRMCLQPSTVQWLRIRPTPPIRPVYLIKRRTVPLLQRMRHRPPQNQPPKSPY